MCFAGGLHAAASTPTNTQRKKRKIDFVLYFREYNMTQNVNVAFVFRCSATIVFMLFCRHFHLNRCNCAHSWCIFWKYFGICCLAKGQFSESWIKAKKSAALPPDLPVSAWRNASIWLRLDVWKSSLCFYLWTKRRFKNSHLKFTFTIWKR